MRYKLIAPVQEKSTFAQVLLNRGVQREDISKFTTTTIKDISKPELFGKEKMEKAVKMVAIASHLWFVQPVVGSYISIGVGYCFIHTVGNARSLILG